MKIAIVCGSPASEMLAPFDDKEWEIWVLGNRLNKFDGKRVTRVFEIHDDLSEHGDPMKYAMWLHNQDYPLIVGEKFPIEDPDITVFPFAEAKELYGSDYLTSSSAYMMAYAILQGATEIAIYGVDMATDDFEYFWQRPCMEAWVGFARGKGIKVTIPSISPLGRSDYTEGKGKGKPDFAKAPFTQNEFLSVAAQHIEKMQGITEHIKQLEMKYCAHDGAKQAYERLAKVARAVESGQDIQSLTGNVSIK